MGKDVNRLIIAFVSILLACLLTGCFNKKSTTDRLYFEQPPSIIGDYSGMVEVKELNWAWFRLGDRFGNYRSITVKPFQNLTSVIDQDVSEKLHKGVIKWFEENGIEVSDNGDITCEGAVVELKLERAFLDKYNPLYEEKNDLSLEVELVITERTTHNTISKIRHGVTGYEVGMLVKQLLDGLVQYFDFHK
ncbi:MAG: hypothetical protein ACTSW1_13910 [Candidatus Hodarchaeales archaeon]